MKISKNVPKLPSPSDLAKAPATTAGRAPVPAPATVAPPTPRVLQGLSNFTGGVERRYSVGFMRGIEARLKMTGLPAKQAQDLTRRFGTMSRSELDQQGRVVDTILSGAHPREGMAIYDFLAKLGSAITPGGFRVAPNHERSWTITPPDGDPFVLPNTPGASTTLGDGTKVQVPKRDLVQLLFAGAAGVEAGLEQALGIAAKQTSGHHAEQLKAVEGSLEGLKERKGEVAAQVGDAAVREALLPMDTALAVASVSVTVVVTTVAISATVATAGAIPVAAVVLAAVTIVQNTPELMNAVAYLAESAGASEAARALRSGSKELEGTLESPAMKPALAMTMIVCAVVISVCQLASSPGRELKDLLARAGQSAAPSRRADPDAERAAILLGAGLQASTRAVTDKAAAELGAFANQVRGQPRELVIKVVDAALRGLLSGNLSPADVLASALK